MRVLIVTPYYPHAANPSYGLFIHQQALALKERGHEVEVIHFVRRVPFWQDPRDPRFHNRNLCAGREVVDGVTVERVLYFLPSRKSLDRFWCPLLGWHLSRFFSTRGLWRDSVIYAQWLLPTAAACLRVKHRFDLPLVAIARGGDLQSLSDRSPPLRRELEAVFAEADQLAANGPWVWREFSRLGLDASSKDIKIIYNIKDLSPFARIQPRYQISSPLELLCVGGLDSHKGIDVLLRAVAGLGREQDFRLTLLGHGLERKRMEALAHELGLAEKVEFKGAVPHEEVVQAMANAHLFILPSRREGMPNALVEAMASGLVCIGTRVGGIPDLIEDGVSGVLVPPESPQALTQAILQLASASEETRARLGENGRRKVLSLFSAGKNLEQLEAALLSALAKKKKPASRQG